MSIPEEVRTACRDAHDVILQQQADLLHVAENLERSASENLRLRLMLSCLLPIADKIAERDSPDAQTVQYIRSALGERPLTGKPELVVDNTTLPAVEFR